MRISFTAIVFLCYYIYKCIFIVRAGLRKRRPQHAAAPAKKTYLPGIMMTTLSAAFALMAAITSKIPVFGSGKIDHNSALLGSAFLILNLCLDPLEWKFTPNDKKKPIVNFLPRTARERVSWVFYSVASGAGEEIIFRAVLFGIMFQLTGNYWIAAVISAVLFAFTHFSYGLMAMVSLSVVALCLQWLVKVSGGLYIAMGVHFFHNLFNGILWGMLTKPEPEGKATEGGVPGHIETNLIADQPKDIPDTAASSAD